MLQKVLDYLPDANNILFSKFVRESLPVSFVHKIHLPIFEKFYSLILWLLNLLKFQNSRISYGNRTQNSEL